MQNGNITCQKTTYLYKLTLVGCCLYITRIDLIGTKNSKFWKNYLQKKIITDYNAFRFNLKKLKWLG